MKAIVCELCGSNDVVKRDGFFVCQHCGTKYTPDEARKLMAEVKVDTSEQKANWYVLARRARDSNDAENAAKYYDLVLQIDPKSWEAAFYSAYFRAMQTKIAFISSAADNLMNSLPHILYMVKENLSTISEKRSALAEIAYRIEILAAIMESNARSTFKSNYESVHYSSELLNQYYEEYMTRCKALFALCGGTASSIETIMPNDQEIIKCSLRLEKKAIQYFINCYPDVSHVRNTFENNIVVQRIRQHEPTYQLPSPEKTGFPAMWLSSVNKVERKDQTNTGTSGGCYIATSVYGSYDCPQVWVLRRFRDYTLADTWYGRAFIHTYYTISPMFVKWFGETEWFRDLWKPKLDRMVERLKKQGIADTPYQDRQW